MWERAENFALAQTVQIGSGTYSLLLNERQGRGSFSGVTWPGCDTDHSRPPIDEIKNEWISTPLPPTCFHGAHRDNYIFTLSSTEVI